MHSPKNKPGHQRLPRQDFTELVRLKYYLMSYTHQLIDLRQLKRADQHGVTHA